MESFCSFDEVHRRPRFALAPGAQPWAGGGSGGTVLPVCRTVASTGNVAVGVTAVWASPQGCHLEVSVTARADGLAGAEWDRIRAGLTGSAKPPRFAVRFADDTLAVEHGGGWPTYRHSDGAWRLEPSFSVTWADATASDDSVRAYAMLWLWPLPPEQPFEFLVEWFSAGVEPTGITLDGAEIAAALRID
ncbi:hypothetical protein NLX83_15970 [Allokutzneria sp. A3M-2-11 16]|uniref:hypothetical protein n=1 Tax=Allokutzneria sp. A3M-2-11 16 TaxID=2962043 RepID=UPI0020B68185|nr:hypothetical protein [Allokutzneria sp. A3M-2-11 16]MCP3800763.1 hypothetical protein [Allokutzneria sp. A3M-2-11 16]